MDGSGAGTAHLSVPRTGIKVRQHVTFLNGPHAQGLIQGRGFSCPLILDNAGINPNYYLVSIEHDARAGQGLTSTQWQRSVQTSAWVWQTEIAPHANITGATVDRRCILQHSDIDSVSRARCAGLTEEEMQRYIAEVAALLAQGPVEPPPPPLADPRDALLSTYRDAMTVQAVDLRARADALEEQAAAARVQANNLERVIAGEPTL